MKIRFKRIGDHDLPLPVHAKPGDAAVDLRAVQDCRIPWGARKMVSCGFAVEIPEGYEGTIRPRSSQSNAGIDVCFGTIDSGWRGELAVILINRTNSVIEIHAGDRIAQMAISPVLLVEAEESQELSTSVRGESGWGSSGLR